MAGISPAARARRRTDAYMQRLGTAQTPETRIAVAYDYLRAAIAVSSPEAISRAADTIVPQLASAASELLAWRMARENA